MVIYVFGTRSLVLIIITLYVIQEHITVSVIFITWKKLHRPCAILVMWRSKRFVDFKTGTLLFPDGRRCYKFWWRKSLHIKPKHSDIMMHCIPWISCVEEFLLWKKIKTKISNLMRTIRFWNSHHQARSMSKIGKAK